MPIRASRGAAWAVVALAPFPFGSVETIWICVWCIVVGASLVTADLRFLTLRKLRLLVPVMVGVMAVVVAVAVQSLAPEPWLPAHPVWGRAAEIVGREIVPAVTATKAEPWRAIGPSLLFVLVFVRVFLLALDPDEADLLHRIVAWTGVAYAVLGVVSIVVDPTMLLWREKRAYLTNLTGTFVNRNTAATYFGTCAIVWLTMLLRAVRRHLNLDLAWREMATELIRHPPPRSVAVPAIGCLVTFAATIMTGSRAGSALTLFGFGAVATLWSSRRGVRAYLAAAAVVAGLGILALEVFGGTLAGRVAARGLGDPSRFEGYRDVMGMFPDSAWFGIGLGSFEHVFPAYRNPDGASTGVWDKAHSTPLELAIEIGLPAFAAVAIASVLIVRGLLLGSWRRRRHRSFAIAGFAVALLGGLHSLVDFSLQIPGYAATFAAVIAIGLAQSLPERPGMVSGSGSRDTARSSRSRDNPAPAVAGRS